ncbi:MAG: MBL fold metallo-hydrolase [Acholeplasma sp.]|nr:MBL fold metallo-hydrolase [Acholeplasma sp.]
MRLYFIASGSSGNATLLQHNNLTILIDAGISFKKISDAFILKNMSILSITHVLLTHEHIDHVRGLNTLFNNINVPLYLSKGTAQALKQYSAPKYEANMKYIEAHVPFQIGDIKITPIPLSHDALEPVGFIFETKTEKIGYITDTGYIREGLIEPLKNCDLYYFEANHDPVLLKNSRRPYHTIHRILTEKGHLSNEDSAYYLAQMIGPNTKKIVMAHISNECNTIEKIKHTYEDVFLAHHLSLSNYEVIYTSQIPSEVIDV